VAISGNTIVVPALDTNGRAPYVLTGTGTAWHESEELQSSISFADDDCIAKQADDLDGAFSSENFGKILAVTNYAGPGQPREATGSDTVFRADHCVPCLGVSHLRGRPSLCGGSFLS
jgi:hypothetical protein